MSSKTYILVDDQTGQIVNRIELEDGAKWDPPDGSSIFEDVDGKDIGGTYQGGVYTPPKIDPSIIPSSAVDAERERRIALPLGVAVPSGASFRINMDTESQRNIQGLSTVGIYLSSAAPTQKTTFRDYDNGFHDLLPGDLVAMGLQVAQRIQAVYAKAWALKALSPIPDDYADDSHW